MGLPSPSPQVGSAQRHLPASSPPFSARSALAGPFTPLELETSQDFCGLGGAGVCVHPGRKQKMGKERQG